ncbi:O-fucosyltransferase family protein [Quillaja saponaria]|uniref:O-fucosyltransferase family protein n=1 Tax=Quillaja saponaria TaxID=32244 RepID=A0AAD7QII7_QUISA|nr:O-fucosyltransferase family protein [Quillaja saponaria]
MAKLKNNTKKLSYISVPSQIISSMSSSSLQSLLLSPKKSSRNKFFGFTNYKSPRLWFLTLFLFCLLGMLKMDFNLEPLIPFSTYPCATTPSQLPMSNGYSKPEVTIASGNGKFGENVQKYEVFSSISQSQLLISNGFSKAQTFNGPDSQKYDEETRKSEFWKQPNGLGYRACLDFSKEYRGASEGIVKNRRKYLMVVVSGGMNQQRNQIVDAVVIARILGVSLVVPILQVNVIWGDESEFSDIFDLEHFKSVLANDVRIVSSLPSTHVMTRPVEGSPPLHVTPSWIRSRYLKRLNREGVLLLRGLDSRLSKDLPSDLQKLRCKVAFHALRFAPPIFELGKKLTERMRSQGPYLALHLRMEKDVWVRTGCLPGLSHDYDEIVNSERQQHPELLTARSNMTYHDRKLAGLCPLNAVEMTRLLKALGAPKNARIYWAGGQPLGGKEALHPLNQEFPHFYNKEDLALPGELEPFAKKASLLAALDYIVSEESNVFMPSHGGNMGHAIQGHRAYAGHKKYITPNKRKMLPYFLNSSLPEAEFNRIVKELHLDSLGEPELRINKSGRDVTKYPVPECMCNDSNTKAHL